MYKVLPLLRSSFNMVLTLTVKREWEKSVAMKVGLSMVEAWRRRRRRSMGQQKRGEFLAEIVMVMICLLLVITGGVQDSLLCIWSVQ